MRLVSLADQLHDNEYISGLASWEALPCKHEVTVESLDT